MNTKKRASKAKPQRVETATGARKLVRDLWWFIENVTPDDPTRDDKFFKLRERVREFGGPHG